MNETKGGSDLCFFNYFLIIVREGKKCVEFVQEFIY